MERLSRDKVMDEYQRRPDVTVLIIGGGINGSSLLRELSLQGIDTLLVDKGDFASGASAACSRMVHGGLRYLESGDLKLVKEALTERNRLLKNASHAVKPICTSLPLFTYFTGIPNAISNFLRLNVRPRQRGALIVKLGLMLYDWLAQYQRVMPSHCLLSKKHTLQRYPKLHKDVKCLAQYYDAFIEHPERLALELLQDARHVCARTQFINYVDVSLSSTGVMIEDKVHGRKVKLNPQVIVNATGAWVDTTNGKLGFKTQFIGGTKGSHLIVDQPELYQALDGDMFFYENQDQRICIVIPFGDLVLIGTTDLRIDDPDTAICTDEEIDYLLKAVSFIFPSITLKRSNIIASFSGVRPLQRSTTVLPGQISREHACHYMPPTETRIFPVFSMYGGKWTTFRSFSELVADRVLNYLNKPRVKASHNLGIGGGALSTEERNVLIEGLQSQYSLAKNRIELMVQRYGRYSQDVLLYMNAEADVFLPHLPQYSVRELKYIILYEHVVSPIDLLARRTQIVLQGLLSYSLLIMIVDIMSEVFEWTEEHKNVQLEDTIETLKVRFGVFLRKL